MEITEDIQGSISYLIRKEYNTIYKKKSLFTRQVKFTEWNLNV